MSYGWLTESSLLPQPSKPIDAPANSMARLREVLYSVTRQSDGEKQSEGTSMRKPTAKRLTADQRQQRIANDGVEQRRAADALSDDDASPTDLSGKTELTAAEMNRLIARSERRMKEKSKLYDDLCHGRGESVAAPLVDFDAKRTTESAAGKTASEATPKSQRSVEDRTADITVETIMGLNTSVDNNNALKSSRRSDDQSRAEEVSVSPPDDAEARFLAEREALEYRATLTTETDRVRRELAGKKKQSRDDLRSRLELMRESKRKKQTAKSEL
eukprot:Selendium_serpulae@DN5210_c0_g1_i4.p1